MIEVKINNIKSKRKTGIILLIIGLIIAGIFFYIYFNINNKKNSYDRVARAEYIDANCMIDSDGDEMCSPIYHFKINDESYECKSSSSSNTFNEDKNEVYYIKNNPKLCLTEFDLGNSFFFLIAALIGCLLILAGIINLIIAIFKYRTIKLLIKKGTLFKGVAYTLDTSGNMNGSHYAIPIVDLAIPNGDTLHLIGDPISNKQFGNTGNTVDVLIDLNHPDKYFIDYVIRMSGEFDNKVIDYRMKYDNVIDNNKNG